MFSFFFITWDGATNPFQYIIQQQFYDISPNLNAATTLYTDNITTMRSDLNVLTNNFDVVSYYVKDITVKVDTLRGEMASQIEKIKYLKAETDKLEVISGIALGFTVVGFVLSIGTSFGATGITFGTQIKGGISQGMGRIRGTVSRIIDEAAEEILFRDMLSSVTRSVTVDLPPVLNWCDSLYSDIIIPYDQDDEFDDPDVRAMTLKVSMMLYNRFRDSLKPAFKMIWQKLSELEFNGEQVTKIETKGEELKSSVKKISDLGRDDTIDIIKRIEENNIILEAENEINTGLIVLQIYVGDKSQWKRRVYIKIEEKVITEYLVVQENKTVIDPAINESITLKLLARSEDDRANLFPDITLEENSIIIEVQNEYKVTSVIIKYNSLTRHMILDVKDLAYTCDNDVLNKKINALAETSHKNDVMMASIQDTYTTVDEVNEAMINYALKSDMDKYVDDFYDKNDQLLVNLMDNVREIKGKIRDVKSDLTNYALKSEVDKYIAKENIINEYQTKIGIEILGSLINRLSFTNISIDDLKQGFYFSFYDSSDFTKTLISNKYSLVSSDGVCINLSDDEMLRIVYTPGSVNNYSMNVYNIRANNKRYDHIKIQDWYIESEGQQYDSTNIYCKEIIDEYFSLKSENEKLKTTIVILGVRLTTFENK